MTDLAKKPKQGTGQWSWSRQLYRWRAMWMRWSGWKCEGPFPNRSSDAVLILGPGLEPAAKEMVLLSHRLQHRITWWQPGDALPPVGIPNGAPPRKRKRVLHPVTGHGLHELLKECGEAGRPIQLVSLAAGVRAIRCNTPFLPGKFTEREEAYVRRIFSYYD